MGKRYTINSEFVFEDCLVTPGVYEGVLQRFDEFVTPYIAHLHTRFQQNQARDYMRGLLSDAERKNVESIAYFHGEDRQKLQKFRHCSMKVVTFYHTEGLKLRTFLLCAFVPPCEIKNTV